MGSMKKLLEEVQNVLNETGEVDIPDPGASDVEIDTEPELYTFDFLELQCFEHQIGKAMAIRNYWAWRCLQ